MIIVLNIFFILYFTFYFILYSVIFKQCRNENKFMVQISLTIKILGEAIVNIFEIIYLLNETNPT